MWIGIVVVLWPCEWKVTGSNLGRQNLTFILLNLVWGECGKVENLAEWGQAKRVGKLSNN